jgi:Zn-dependent protease with chaperone function
LSQKDQAVQQAVDQLASHVGVVPVPVIEMPHGLQGTSGQAFGLGKRFSIRLDGGLRVWRRTKPDLFRAVVFHELAHIANQDVWRSYFSDALWRAILIWSLAPLILLIGGRFLWNSLASLLDGNCWLTGFRLSQWPWDISQSAMTICCGNADLETPVEFYADYKASLGGADR